MTMPRSVLENALGGVLSAVLLAAGAWLLGFWPAVWGFLLAAASWTWSVLSVRMPVWAGLLVVVGLWGVTRALAFFQGRRVVAPGADPEQPAQNPLDGLSANATRLLRELAEADGQIVLFDDLCRRIGLSRLYTERALNELLLRELIETHRNVLHGSGVSLSAVGRDCVIDAGLVSEQLRRSGW